MLSINGSIGYAQPLSPVAFEFLPGTIYGITGANGSGKSTLLRTLAGEIEPFDGTALIDGTPVSDRSTVGRIMYISDPDFYPDLSIGEHLKVLEKTGGLDYDHAVSTWELAELLDSPPSHISSGQRQRSFLASQLGISSDVFLLDEPERHLDGNWVLRLCAVLEEKSASGSTVIVASHHPVVVEMCSEIVELGQ